MEHLRGRRIWVTGAGGFVGGHLVPRLRDAGAEVTPTDHDLDVTDAALVEATLRRLKPDAVVHLAAASSVAASFRDAEKTWRVNYLGARAVLAGALAQAPETRVLLVSSGSVYGSAAPDARPFRETDPLRPDSPYAWSKACADLLGAHYAAQGLAVVRARPFNHTGPGQSDTFVASSFARQLAEIEAGRREPILRVGNLDSVRDFLAVEDVVEAYVRLLDPEVPVGVYNVARGSGTRVRDLLEHLLTQVQKRPEIRSDPARFRPTDEAVGDPGRMASLGWGPARPIEASLTSLLESWQRAI